MLMILGEPRSLAVLLPLVVLLTVLYEAALALSRRSYPFALDDVFDRLRRWRFVELLDEARVRARAMLPLGVQ
jgi:hypothetical protein